MFFLPSEAIAWAGATASRNASVDEVRLPWWPSLSTSARKRDPSSEASSARSASPAKTIERRR